MKLITIIDSDDDARTAYVQVNESADIGTGAEGSNARHEFVLELAGDDDPRPLWKGSVAASLRAVYPGATVHGIPEMNAKIETVLTVEKHSHVKLEDGRLVTHAEKAVLDARAAEAEAERQRVEALAAEAANAAAEPASPDITDTPTPEEASS